MVIWVTGLPGAGKTTISKILLERLRSLEYQAVLLDGDQLRIALQTHAYDIETRKELAFTYSRLARMLSEQQTIAICATVSMFDEVRNWNSENITDYIEVYLDVPKKILLERNQKGIYSSALSSGENNIPGFGLEIEEPKSPDLKLVNDGTSAPQLMAETILSTVLSRLNENT